MTDTAARQVGPNQPIRGVLTTDRSSIEYQTVLQELANPNNVPGRTVGGTGGVDDRMIVTDAFFAESQPGAIPRFATADSGVYNPLARIAGIGPAQLGRPVHEVFPDGFDVTLNGRTIRVIPLPRQ
ncbi:MAG: hypothetical protein IGS54_15615 [Elainella sp. C42_A2020_010]|nr:hypothetical protein [Elainella sp. C42_A2020_010]